MPIRMLTAVSICLIMSVGASAFSDEFAPDDETITFWVGEALREDPRVWVADIDISTKDGNVRLSGAVNTLMQQRFAGAIASKIRGVGRVTNDLKVVLVARVDVDIEREVILRLRTSGGVRAQELKVTCLKGHVTLEGRVESAGYRAEAINIASEVPGVRSIRNALTIRPTSQRSDKEIADELANTFFRDVYLTGLDIRVTSSDGRVTLSGTVGNAYQKDRAAQLARNTANVVDVTNDIATNRLMERGERRTETRPSNEELAEAVEVRLASDSQIAAGNIRVHAVDGHVTLRGHVPTMRQRQLAEITTQQVAGAIWVTNVLSVRTQLRPDEVVRSEIVDSLARDPMLRDREIDVVVFDGLVTLGGVVTSHLPRMRAAAVVGRIPGVRGIRNGIELRWVSVFRDVTLQQHIVTRLRGNWETTYVAKRIAVTVTDGHVVLSGDVDSWAQRREAGRMTLFTTGVRSVQNRLTIRSVEYPWEDWNSDRGPDVPADWIHEFRGDFFERPGAVRG